MLQNAMSHIKGLFEILFERNHNIRIHQQPPSLLRQIGWRFSLLGRNACKTGGSDGSRWRMPHRGDDFRTHHVVRKYPRRIEVGAPAICVEEALLHQTPADVSPVLPRKIKRISPAAWTHLVHILRVSHRAPNPAYTGVAGRAEVLCVGNIHTTHADVERMFPQIAIYGLY